MKKAAPGRPFSHPEVVEGSAQQQENHCDPSEFGDVFHSRMLAMNASSTKKPEPARHLLVILGDQLDQQSPLLARYRDEGVAFWMAEVPQEAQHVPSSLQRTVVFLSAMRHHAQWIRSNNWALRYVELEDPLNLGSLGAQLSADIEAAGVQTVCLVQPGDWRVLEMISASCRQTGAALEVLEDTHFISRLSDFKAFASNRKQIRLEHWYRQLRQKTGLLMVDGEPVGGVWNLDAENRKAFGKEGPGEIPQPARFEPDQITLAVMETVKNRFPDAPGSIDEFGWPLTRDNALLALERFVRERLPLFGTYEDAMWQGEAWLYHSHLSVALNLKLLNPLEVVQAAEAAYQEGAAPLNAVEGFIRQILGWREFVRGIYWTEMPAYLESNALGAHHQLPALFWTGQTPMACMADAINQTLRTGYAHHIQRLMVTGLYSLLFGVSPKAIHEWYLSVYVDAVEWAEVPNVLGMSQYADGGRMASKPYVASGKYIQRMSNHCANCALRPDESVGPKACPFTTLYWEFLDRHEALLQRNPRMGMQLKNLQRLDASRRQAIRDAAAAHRLEVL